MIIKHMKNQSTYHAAETISMLTRSFFFFYISYEYELHGLRVFFSDRISKYINLVKCILMDIWHYSLYAKQLIEYSKIILKRYLIMQRIVTILPLFKISIYSLHMKHLAAKC